MKGKCQLSWLEEIKSHSSRGAAFYFLQPGKGTTLNNIGAVYQAQGECDQALNQYQQALVITREIGYKALEEAVLTNIENIPDN